MDLKLSNKVVLVTGSSRGLGKGICEAFLSEKSKVVLTGTDNTRLQKVESELREKYDIKNVISYCGDLTSDKDIEGCINKSLEYFGKIDILICNLGSGRSVADWNPSEEEWEWMINLNFNGARKIVNKVVPGMIKNNGGSLIFIASIAGKEVIGAPISYSVAKTAVISYAKNLSFKLAPFNIRVNSICPGNIYFENGTWDIKKKENPETVEKMLKNNVPLKRFTTPEEIANLVLFVSSDKASFITGSCLVADGGQSVSI